LLVVIDVRLIPVEEYGNLPAYPLTEFLTIVILVASPT
jgi:hypothetical protein